MLPKLKRLVTTLICSVGAACTPVNKPPTNQQVAGKERWAAYYAKELPAETFHDYDLVVFDRIYHPNLNVLKGKVVQLSYISLGEVHGDTDEQKLLHAQGALISPRSKWGSYTVDIASKTWEKIVFEQVQDALDQGFDGVMLDTVDSALHLADMDSPAKGERAATAAVKLIAALRQQYPDMKIMLNRGFEILPRVAPAIDYALGESTLAETNVSAGQSKLFPATTYQNTAAKLMQARAIAPRLKIYTLDYWNQDDAEGIKKLYAIHRAHGFNPYITTPDLRRHTPEPAGTYVLNKKVA